MSRCREIAGVLFKHECAAEAVAACATCSKPICGLHGRQQGAGMLCVSCLRERLKDPQTRGTFAYLRDDPYFYWYYNDVDWFADPYGADDFALFDEGAGAIGGDVPDDWSGS